MNHEADWIPLMDYAIKNGVSLSTLRRHIKANKIPYKVENGRYLLRSTGSAASPMNFAKPSPAAAPQAASPSPASAAEAQELRARLQSAQEEIAELKMLIAIYEEQIAQQNKNTSSGTLFPPRPGQMRMNG